MKLYIKLLSTDEEAAMDEKKEKNSKQLETGINDEKADAIRKVSELVKELVGERSIRKTGEEAGVAASYITGIIKQKYLPSADILRKLTATNARPRNGISLEDLMVAAGYQDRYYEGDIKDDEDKVIVDRHGKSLMVDNEKRRKRELEIRRFESLSTGIIFRTLAANYPHFTAESEIGGARGFKPSIAVCISNKQPIIEWWFDIKYMSDDVAQDPTRGVSVIRQTLGRYMFVEPSICRKISLVISNEDVFNRVLGYKDKLSYRGDLSIILINEDTLSFAEEEYLSHFKPEKKNEFFLAPR